MGGQQSAEASRKPKSYDQPKYKPAKNGSSRHDTATKSSKLTINNNYLPNKAALSSVNTVYNVTYSSDDTVTTHKEITELRLEAAQHDIGSKAISPLKVDIMCETESRLHFKVGTHA